MVLEPEAIVFQAEMQMSYLPRCTDCFWYVHLSIYLSIYPIVLGTVGAPHHLATNIRHSSRYSALLTASLSSKPAQSRMLSSHHMLCLPLLLSPSPYSALEDCLGKSRSSGDMFIPLHFASFYSGQEFFIGSNGFPNRASHFFVGDVVFVRDAKETSETSHSTVYIFLSISVVNVQVSQEYMWYVVICQAIAKAKYVQIVPVDDPGS